MITLFYRSYIRECNYTCSYCPFIKGKYTNLKLQKDKEYFNQFINYLKENFQEEYEIFLAPRGEIMVLEHYFSGIKKLLKLDNMKNLVVQSNFSGAINWLKEIENKEKFNFWLTYHPEFVTLEDFTEKLSILDTYEINYSVGAVGIKEKFLLLEKLRSLMKPERYLWINAYKDKKNYYSQEDIKFLTELDSFFLYNLEDYKSFGKSCNSGKNSFFVEYNGNIRRCLESRKIIGNLYKDKIENIRDINPCNKKLCDCFIGYINLKREELDEVYANSLGRRK